MTPQQAIEILNQATSQIETHRENHLKIIEALKVLNLMIKSTIQNKEVNYHSTDQAHQ